MLVVTPDKELRRAIKRLTTATGSSAQFAEHESEADTSVLIDLAIFDARKRGPGEMFARKLPETARVLYIVKPGSLFRSVHLFDSPQATSLFCHDEQFDSDEFIASATKALRGDIFGLQKYFPWGVTTFSMLVMSYEEKTMAIDIMMDYARLAGVRGPVRDRAQLVADELMMNALYHAPTDEEGRERNRNKSPKELSRLKNVDPIEVQYGCSGQYFGISVRDGFGSLTRAKALEYLKRSSRSRSEIEEKRSGAGLGLISVLKSASKLIFNLDPGYSTEAICLFDMQVQGSGMVGARSLHLFTAAPDNPEEEAQQTAITQFEEPSRVGLWAFAAVLGAIVAALGSAYYMKSGAASNIVPASEPSLTLVATPSDAVVTLNGKAVVAGSAWSIDKSVGTMHIEVSKEGYETWSRTIEPGTLETDTSLFVELHPRAGTTRPKK
jgi:hypothetical protein